MRTNRVLSALFTLLYIANIVLFTLLIAVGILFIASNSPYLAFVAFVLAQIVITLCFGFPESVEEDLL